MSKKTKSQLLKYLAVALLTMLSLPTQAQRMKWDLTVNIDEQERQWVDSVFYAMTPDERLGQLFMLRAHSNLGADHIRSIESMIKKYQIGGLCFFQGTAAKQAELINKYQSLSKNAPLLIAMDAEWGLGMRFKATNISFPKQLTLGAVQNNQLIYDMGKEVARQLRRAGVHINFAPVADVNNNAANPVINMRSFGEDRYNVAVKSYMYAMGLQDNDVMACAKHFPGHGDTAVDSHYELPVIRHPMQRLDSIELYPFEALFNNGIGSVMVAHLNVPALDSRDKRPTTLSQPTITGLAKEQLNFKGLVFTDALDMKGVTKYYEPGQVEAEALLAGSDALLLPENVGAAIREINKYVADGRIPQEQVDQSVKKILRTKYRLNLSSFTPIETKNIEQDLNSIGAKALKQRLIENALTLVRNRDDLLPLTKAASMNLASLSIGASGKTHFQSRLEEYSNMPHFQTGKSLSSSTQERLLKSLGEKDAVIVGVHNMSEYASRDFGLSADVKQFIEKLRRETNVILTLFGNPYSLKYFDHINWLINAYEGGEMFEEAAAQAIFGAIGLSGRLPVTASGFSRYNGGVNTVRNFKLGYARPENMGMDPDTLRQIDKIAQEAIDGGATPGCVVLVAKSGNIVYHKAFGHHTTARRRKVQKDDIYDLASVTKIAATTLSVMKLQEEGKIDIDQPLSKYLPELRDANKGSLIIRDVMAHHAGLIGWIPFYEQTITSSKRNPQPLSAFYQKQKKDRFNIPVAANLYLREDYQDSIRSQINDSNLRQNNNYRYSDLGFYLLADLVRRVSGQSIDQYARETFYEPLGLKTATYNPWRSFPLDRIPPSENDRYFRRRVVHGYVHDMGAAMLGGVSGHAGLFSNATDLAVLLQMLLQDGYYDGKRYLQPATVKRFTSRHPRSTRRGIGFDMLELDRSREPNLSTLASAKTFGHLGFTGISAWADPEYDLVYIFLSNRTYPSMHNYKLVKMDIRPRIQSTVYRSMAAFQNPEQGNKILDGRRIAGKD